jgi:hypothetical protein
MAFGITPRLGRPAPAPNTHEPSYRHDFPVLAREERYPRFVLRPSNLDPTRLAAPAAPAVQAIEAKH